MTGTPRTLWASWAVCAALLALELAIPGLLPSRPQPWYEAQRSVASFVLALLAMIAAVGSFTLRESLVGRELRLGTLDPQTPAGSTRVLAGLLALWSLCLLVGLFGGVLAWGAASPRAAWPFALAAAALLVLHAPRGWLFRKASPDAGGAGAEPGAR